MYSRAIASMTVFGRSVSIIKRRAIVIETGTNRWLPERVLGAGQALLERRPASVPLLCCE